MEYQMQVTNAPQYDFNNLGVLHIELAYFKALEKCIDECGITDIDRFLGDRNIQLTFTVVEDLKSFQNTSENNSQIFHLFSTSKIMLDIYYFI